MVARRRLGNLRPILIVLPWSLGASLTFAHELRAQPLSNYVNTLRGTNSTPEFSRGNTFPAVAVPFGFNFWTPITEANSDRWLYQYGAQAISGFAVSHEPSPWVQDHGSLQVMPMLGKLRTAPNDRKAAFRHDNEVARAHYYSVGLDGDGITVEITPTEHASKWRFTFAKAGNAFVLFNSIDSVAGSVSIDKASCRVEGFVDHNGPRLYFVANLNKPISNSSVAPGKSLTGWVEMNVVAQESVEMAMATSFISIEQARRNLELEVGRQSFEQVKQNAATEWDHVLSKIELQGGSENQKVTFYSNLYRAFLYPNSMWENVDGKPKYFSPYSQRLADGKIYANNGFWDTYRAVWPLYSVLSPRKAAEMLEGFVNAFRDGGWVPRWSAPGYLDCMVGSNSDIVFADSYLRHVTGFDIKTAYQSMLRNALTYSAQADRGRKGNERSIFKGYVPTDRVPEATAWTLEDVINDYGIAQIASLLGDSANYEYFLNRSRRYVELFSPSVGFFRGRRDDGKWRTPDAGFSPNEWGFEFTEGDAWHYTAAATSDPQGMVALFGGTADFGRKLDAVFTAPRDYKVGSYNVVIHEMREAYEGNMGQYAHANEPTHSLIYMYNYANRPSTTQFRVRQVLDYLYQSGIGTGNGYLGDEDNGQMSAWYVFSALGFYPASPGHPIYTLGSPLFTRATIRLENGKTFTIKAPANSRRNIFIQSARLNGAAYSKNYLTHDVIMAGGVLDLVMGDAPSQWGTGGQDAPNGLPQGRVIGVPTFRVDGAVGGKVTASSEASKKYGALLAFDDDSLTEWHAKDSAPFVQYKFAHNNKHAVSLYTLTSAAESPEQDPRDWTLLAADDCVHWHAIDRRRNEQFTWRRHTRAFVAQNHTPYACYRLKIDANNGGATTQLAEIELIGDAPLAAAQAVNAPGCDPQSSSAAATDGSLHTKWCPTAASSELKVDLGDNQVVNQVIVYHAGAGGEPTRFNTRAFTIESSLDGVAWTRLSELGNNYDSVTQHNVTPTLARYVRLTVKQPNDGLDEHLHIYEVEVYTQPTDVPH